MQVACNNATRTACKIAFGRLGRFSNLRRSVWMSLWIALSTVS